MANTRNAGRPPVPASAAVTLMWSQIVWSGTRVSAGSHSHSAPSQACASRARMNVPSQRQAARYRRGVSSPHIAATSRAAS